PAMAMARDRRTTRSPRGRAHRLLEPRLGWRDSGTDRAERHQHLFESIDVDGGLDLRILEESLTLLVDGGDVADRHAGREDAVETGADHQVAHLQVLGPLHEFEPAPPLDGSLHYASPAGSLDHGIDAAVVVRDQQHAGGVRAGEEDLPDEPARRQHRGALRDTRPGTLVDRDGARHAGRVVTDDAGREELAAQRPAELEQRAQTIVLEPGLGQPAVSRSRSRTRARRSSTSWRARQRSS